MSISYRKYQISHYKLDFYGVRNGMQPKKKARLRRSLKKRIKNIINRENIFT